jgi:hypothetical protein
MKSKEQCCCHTELKPNVIEKQTFDNERAICKQLYHEKNGSCCWGECDKCGVIPLLYKLHKGILLEDRQEIQEIKKQEFDATYDNNDPS